MSYYWSLLQEAFFGHVPKKQAEQKIFPHQFYDSKYGLTNVIDNPTYHTAPVLPVSNPEIRKINMLSPAPFVLKPEYEIAYNERKLRALQWESRIGQIDPYAHNIKATKRGVFLNGTIKDSKFGSQVNIPDGFMKTLKGL